MIKLQTVLPKNIEKKSFEIITKELGDRKLDPSHEPIIKRVIHTTADFDYVDSLVFSNDVVQHMKEAIRRGICIVTDTHMAKAGINKKRLAEYGGEVHCFMSDEDVARQAAKERTTRAAASMKKAATLGVPLIFAIGNAPTALVQLYDMITNDGFHPECIIGVPVGFVNVVEAKELILQTNISHIIAKGRKGGSNVAAAIVNAVLYQL
jgi:precorrin-8X/cobalt-precorrin-8 methylmutase